MRSCEELDLCSHPCPSDGVQRVSRVVGGFKLLCHHRMRLHNRTARSWSRPTTVTRSGWDLHEAEQDRIRASLDAIANRLDGLATTYSKAPRWARPVPWCPTDIGDL